MEHVFRFFSTKINKEVDRYSWFITDTELYHLHKVLRLKIGDVVEVFDGQGSFACGQIQTLIPGSHAVVVTAEKLYRPPIETSLSLCVGALKSSTMEEMLPYLVELGTQEIHVFLQMGLAKFRINEKAQLRWQNIILQSCKQSKINWLPKLIVWSSLDDMLAKLTAPKQKLFLSQSASKEIYDKIIVNSSKYVVIGSEKGLSKEEQLKLECAGYEAVSFGKSVLRSVTAAISVASIFRVVQSN
jgi:16S rRNA (uracil1498-N3)-methyltransferase